MRRVHAMPFGTRIDDDGSSRFRLWAPAAKHVTLWLRGTNGERECAMQPTEAGWFEIDAHDAPAGSRYAFRIDDDERRVPDPASRFQPEDVHAASELVDPESFLWEDEGWRGRPWEEAIIYELHIGAFTPAGTFAALAERLDALAELGVTAIQLMPVGDFPGTRNWGYDGVLPFAPDAGYGRPEDLKRLVVEAHRRGLMLLLDVVYNHFGPDGNYLHRYAPQFFTDRYGTPWGDAVNFDGEGSRQVRDFFMHNALYWLEEYHLDGLRLDAVHAIVDASEPDILDELAASVRRAMPPDRHVHLILENDHNAAHYLWDRRSARHAYDAQWNDDAHHALHALLTGERSGYYIDYADDPMRHLGRTLGEGFAYQGEVSRYRGGARRGEPSRHLPPVAFVTFLQNHDQVGNRAWGERITRLATPDALRAAVAILLLAPSPPLLFMGEEWGASTPFLYFCDFHPELAALVAKGRRTEFGDSPDPNALETFAASMLRWEEREHPDHTRWLAHYRDVLRVRRREIVPRLRGMNGNEAQAAATGAGGLRAQWRLGDGSRLTLLANLAAAPLAGMHAPSPAQRIFVVSDPDAADARGGELPPWSVQWWLEP